MTTPRDIREAATIDWSAVALPGLGLETVSLITGGTGAIGYRAAEVLVGWGGKVAVMGRSQERVTALTAKLDGPGEAIALWATWRRRRMHSGWWKRCRRAGVNWTCWCRVPRWGAGDRWRK